jgi:hypothetical protein
MAKLEWAWCCVAFNLYMMLPMARSHKSLYGRFTLWLLSYAGTWAYCENFEDWRRRIDEKNAIASDL